MSGPFAPPGMGGLRTPPGQVARQAPAPPSDAARRIQAARRMNVQPDQVQQQPGYRAPAPARPPASPPQAQQEGASTPPMGTPMPRPRPAGAPNASSDFIRQALEMEARKQQALDEQRRTPVRAGPPVGSPEEFMRLAQAMANGQRSGGGTVAAPSTPAAVTPPAAAPAVSPPQAPPPVIVVNPPGPPQGMPLRGDTKRWAQEKEAAGKDVKYPKSTIKGSGKSQAAGANMNYYAILGVEPGDNVGAARAFEKLRAREKSDPASITMEEDKLLASSGKIPAYNRSMEPKAVQDRFAARKDPAEEAAYTTIQKAGTPETKKLPTQEDVNKNPGAYKKRTEAATVDTDRQVQTTEDEGDD